MGVLIGRPLFHVQGSQNYWKGSFLLPQGQTHSPPFRKKRAGAEFTVAEASSPGPAASHWTDALGSDTGSQSPLGQSKLPDSLVSVTTEESLVQGPER